MYMYIIWSSDIYNKNDKAYKLCLLHSTITEMYVIGS